MKKLPNIDPGEVLKEEFADWQNAQAASLAHVRDNADDEVWNDIPLRRHRRRRRLTGE